MQSMLKLPFELRKKFLKLAEDADPRYLAAWTVGCVSEERVLLLGLIRPASDISVQELELDKLVRDAEDAQSLLPAGLSIVGLFATTSDSEPHRSAAQLAKLQEKLTAQGVISNGCIHAIYSGNATLSFWTAEGDAIEAAKVENDSRTAAELLEAEFVLLRLQLPVQSDLVVVRGSQPSSESIEEACKNIEEQLASDSALLLVRSPSGEDAQLLGSGPESSSSNPWEITFRNPGSVDIVVDSRSESATVPHASYEPFKGEKRQLRHIHLQLDVLWYVPKRDGLGSLQPGILRQAVRRQLQALRRLIQGSDGVLEARALHFWPPGMSHHCTLLSQLPAALDSKAAKEAEEKLTDKRRKLHEKLLLPVDRPLLRISNAATFSMPSTSGPLRDVHRGIPSSGVKGGEQHTIWGNYIYYHYMQGKFDDNGWGCAYRSLQTIWSWFQLQHYTDKPVPSHKEIQQALVDIGDKSRNFVGSRQWIGAIELGFVLETLLEITSRVITVSDGADIDKKAAEIADHFDKQGTPIMIGGGVLAYTLLGIDLNRESGECAYLILDPHYTGTDDLRRIQRGRWIAWHQSDSSAAAGGELFRRNAFYNFLCPQRPEML